MDATRWRARNVLTLILLGYLVLSVLFAVYTPPWQAPDEPAHYNYVRYLAENGSFPVLQMGDYPHDYLEEIKSKKFPPDSSIDPIRYESHQPPLYYVLVAPLYVVADGSLLPLRLFSVLFGAGVVLLAYAIARRIFPNWVGIGLGTTAFVAFLPQHLATVSQVGNDVLAELLFALVLFQLVGWVMEPLLASDYRSASATVRAHFSGLLGMGILLGLILITKTTVYIAVPLVGGVLIWRWWRERAPVRRILAELALVAVPVALVAVPWYARDVWAYGWPDFLGLNRHDAIVVGQLRTGDYLAQYGWGSYLRRLVEFTFKSFWGVFGWLGVFMESRVYLVLLILCLVAAGGLVLRVACWVFRRDEVLDPPRTMHHISRTRLRALVLLAASVFLTLLSYAWYNLTFVQHQGRYLFTALIPVAIGFALGWDEVLRRGEASPSGSAVPGSLLLEERPGCGQGVCRNASSLLVAAGLALWGFFLAIWGLSSGQGLPRWPLAVTIVFAAGLAIRPWLPRRLDGLLFALPFATLPLLDLYALFGVIVPQLAR